MHINDDLTQPIFVHAAKLDWLQSPAAGVDRRMLYRVGEEVARATTIVRYAPGSVFPRHSHTGGEEILVLEGTFQDEHGDYPAGCYFRNPPGTSHVPAAKDGCTIFVRLWQYREGDLIQIVQPQGEGQRVLPRSGCSSAIVLFDDGHEQVRIEDWNAGETITVANARGLEFLVISGGMSVGDENMEPQSWGRLPAGSDLVSAVGAEGAKVWIKDAQLMHPDILEMPQ